MKITFINESIGCLHAKLIGNEIFFNDDDVCKLIGINSTEAKDNAVSDFVLFENIAEITEHSKDFSQVSIARFINWQGVCSLLSNSSSEKKSRVRNWLNYFVHPVLQCIDSRMFRENLGSLNETLEITMKS